MAQVVRHRGVDRLMLGVTLMEVLIGVLIVGVLAEMATVTYQNYKERTSIATAANDLGMIASEIAQYGVDHNGGLPDSLAQIGRAATLDPWGNPYQYLNHTTLKGNGGVRKDKNIVPINSDFDLYSMGKDGLSQGPLTAPVSRDDIVRANNGRFYGLAADYDP